ncbi:MAG TPA: type II toxin-antitoxin system VapC family toxin [Acidobacteriaceae bacterium]|jgi:tRNA(fMet)-specific endonuclease VapC
MLDTNIVIYLRQGRHPKVAAHFQRLTLGSTVMSIITSGELYFGVEKSERPKESLAAVERLLERIPPLPMELEVARQYARLRMNLQSRGQSIGSNDLWIAAHALSTKLILVTNNEREFRRVPGLKIENWAT